MGKSETKSFLISAGKQIGKQYLKRTINQAMKSYGSGRSRSKKRQRVRLRFRRPSRKALRRARAANRSRRNRMDIKKMKCFINARTAVHVHRQRRSGRVLSNPGMTNIVDVQTAGSKASIEASFNNLRYFDPATNALVVGDPFSGTYSRDICLSIVRKLLVRNNYQVPVHVQVWSCRPKDASQDSALSLYTSGLVDQNNPSSTSPLVYVSDSKDLTCTWNIKCVVNRTLQPGQSATASANDKRFDYQISVNDENTVAFQKKQGGHNFLIRVTGILGHDNAGAAQYGIIPAGVDYLFDAVYRVEYDAGKDLQDYSVDDTSASTFTSAGVVSQKPLADNQGYSLS